MVAFTAIALDPSSSTSSSNFIQMAKAANQAPIGVSEQDPDIGLEDGVKEQIEHEMAILSHIRPRVVHES